MDSSMRDELTGKFLSQLPPEYGRASVSIEEAKVLLTGSDLSESLSLVLNQHIVIEVTSTVQSDGEEVVVVEGSTPSDFWYDIRAEMTLTPFAGWAFRGDNQEEVVRQFLRDVVTLIDFSV